jgi:hypothetical protein
MPARSEANTTRATRRAGPSRLPHRRPWHQQAGRAANASVFTLVVTLTADANIPPRCSKRPPFPKRPLKTGGQSGRDRNVVATSWYGHNPGEQIGGPSLGADAVRTRHRDQHRHDRDGRRRVPARRTLCLADHAGLPKRRPPRSDRSAQTQIGVVCLIVSPSARIGTSQPLRGALDRRVSEDQSPQPSPQSRPQPIGGTNPWSVFPARLGVPMNFGGRRDGSKWAHAPMAQIWF